MLATRFPAAPGARAVPPRPQGCDEPRADERQFTDESIPTGVRAILAPMIRRAEALQRWAAEPIGMQISDYIEWCIDEGHSGDHIKHKDLILRQFARDAAVGSILDLNAAVLTGHLRELARRGFSSRSQNHRRAVIVAFANWLKVEGRLEDHDLARVRKRNEDAARVRVRRSLTADELGRLFEVARERGREAWYSAAYYAGLRKGDLVRLRWRHVDADARTVTIEAGKSWRVDVIPLHPRLAELLAERKPRGATPEDHVFPRVVTDITRRKDFARAGIDEVDDRGRWADLHALRTTLATDLARLQVPASLTMAIMRHRKIETTLKHYTDFSDDDLRVVGAVGESIPTHTRNEKGLFDEVSRHS